MSLKNPRFRSVPWPGNARDDRPGTHLSADSQGPIATHRPGNGCGSAVDRPILYHPEKFAKHLQLQMSVADGCGISMLTNPTIRIDSRYDQKFVRFKTDRTEADPGFRAP